MLPIGFKGRNWLQALGSDFNSGVPLIAVYFDSLDRKKLLSNKINNVNYAENYWASMIPKRGDLLGRAMQMDFENYLPEDILVKIDRASMLASLEVRAPMLDQFVAEFAFRKVPSTLKATCVDRKILLLLAKRLLPATFNFQRKQGFSIPMSNWLESGPWLSFFKEVLFDEQQHLFNKAVIEKLFYGQSLGL